MNKPNNAAINQTNTEISPKTNTETNTEISNEASTENNGTNVAIHYTEAASVVPKDAIPLPIVNVLNKTNLLTALADAGDFPNYFSHNWDSAWDCLTDSEVECLQLDLTSLNEIDAPTLRTFIDIIEEAYESYGKPQLWIIVNCLDESKLS